MGLIDMLSGIVWGMSRQARRRRWRRRRRSLRSAPLEALRTPSAAQAELSQSPPTCQQALSRYVRYPSHFARADSARLLVNGDQAYSEMLAAIDAAALTVDLETYAIRDDNTGRRFALALRRAARRGARVRLLYDWVGSLGISEGFMADVIGAGVDVRVYHPLAITRPSWAINRRDHRKILVVDGRVGFTGGLNITDDFAPRSEGGRGWRDTHVRLEGLQVAHRLGTLFEYGWRKAVPHAGVATRRSRLSAGVRRRWRQAIEDLGRARKALPPPGQCGPGACPVCAAGGAAVAIIGNEEFRYRRRIYRAYMYAIRNARRYVLIENAYFIPDRAVRRALERAARRGVTVAVAVARRSDVATVAYASRHLYGELLRRGVRIFEWPEGMLHAKTAVIDDAWSIVGSYNFDARSLLHQLEAVAVVADPAFAIRLRDRTLDDMARSHEVKLASYRRRPWVQKVLEVLAYMLRRWL
ncbi:MAG: phosphatidylserine/phosphatidylglycerophosphate/cardiolipin synthase family protein [Phycisphaerae bacterium]